MTDEIGYNCQKNTEGEQRKISNIKIIRFVKGSEVCFYKNSYKDITWEKAQMKKAGTRRSGAKDIGSIKNKTRIQLENSNSWKQEERYTKLTDIQYNSKLLRNVL